MALKCSLPACDKELDDNILVTSYVDRLNESYSGLYCQYSHMIADMITDIFTTESFIELASELLPDIANAMTPAQATVIAAPVSDDLDILFAADTTETADGSIDLGTADNSFINDQQTALDTFIDSLLAYSASQEYLLDVNRLPSTFVHNNNEYNCVMYSLFCEDPTFSITMTYKYDSLTVAFADPAHNFGLVDLNDFFEHTQTAVEKLYEVLLSKIHDVLGLSVSEANDETSPEPEEATGGPMLFSAGGGTVTSIDTAFDPSNPFG